MKSGMKYLIESFYRSIREGTPPPIPYREILLTARIMDAIFEQIARREPGISIDVSTINMTAEDSAGVDRAIVANSRVTS